MEYPLGSFLVEVATEFGPRVTGLRRDGERNILAILPPEVSVGPPDAPFRFRGGHRIWAGPEDPDITYAPDEGACSVNWEPDTITVSARPDRVGIIKELTVTSAGESLRVVNRLMFARDLGRRLAPWAITQFPYGGTAIVPLAGASTEPLPNRKLVLWPYTSPADPRIDFRDGGVLVDASGESSLKIGTGPSPGRLGYWRGGQLFLKEVESGGGREVPDFGAAGQVFVGSGFCELESVGGLSAANEGVVMSLTEVWNVSDCPDLDTAIAETYGAAR